MIKGRCRCGATQYIVDLPWPPLTYACHCTLCQRATGSAFAHQYPVPEKAFQVTGKLVEAEVTEPDGLSSVHRHCAACLTRLFGTSERRPRLVIVRAGTIEGSERITPILHLYTSTKQPWLLLPSDAAAFLDGASPEEFSDVWSRNLHALTSSRSVDRSG